jgi:hypothetical protein
MSARVLPKLLWSLKLYAMLVAFSPSYLFAKKGSNPVYEDLFDIGSGGASLTRAAQGGLVFSNPALIPYGDGFHRWAGIEPTVMAGKDSVDFAKNMGSGESSDAATMLNSLAETPAHFGVGQATSYINRGFGLSLFNRIEPDMEAKKFGDTGLPQVNFEAESYHGAGMSFASLLGTKAISLGATVKYLYAAEPELKLEATDQDAISGLSSSEGMESLVQHNTGVGYDAGLLFFRQGVNLDFKMALKADDIGATALSGDGTLTRLPASYSAGLGTTVHNGIDALHLSVDYRDLQGAYKEKLFKRIHAGGKIVFHRFLGIGFGIRDGWPAYACELNFVVLRATAAMWTRELGESPGMKTRHLYAVGVAVGY